MLDVRWTFCITRHLLIIDHGFFVIKLISLFNFSLPLRLFLTNHRKIIAHYSILQLVMLLVALLDLWWLI